MPLDFFSTYTLRALVEEIQPETFFFTKRYFPTTREDIFKTDKVLFEYHPNPQNSNLKSS